MVQYSLAGLEVTGHQSQTTHMMMIIDTYRDASSAGSACEAWAACLRVGHGAQAAGLGARLAVLSERGGRGNGRDEGDGEGNSLDELHDQ